MLRHSFVSVLAAAALAACGSDGITTDPGRGSGTLLVDGSVGYEGGAAELRVTVERAGVAVLDAVVEMESDLGTVALVHEGGGSYRALQAGWGDGYLLRVEAGEDYLEGAIDAPAAVQLTEPDPLVPFDPHLAANGMVLVRWAGDGADAARVKTKDFEWTGVDAGELQVPAIVFVEASQELEVRRENRVILAGGAPGSDLNAHFDAKVTLLVSNPYDF